MINKEIELLAPVGSMEALYSAVENGADAVYLGGKSFSARHYASNFDFEELKLAVEYAHLRNVKVYVTVNTLIDNKELRDVLGFIKYLYNIDVDGLILQDLGLIYLVSLLFPNFEIHGSTQMTVNNLPGAKFLEELGLKRVVLSREVPIDEIGRIYENSNIELEVFIHGALCVSYSGQCLMSSILGGRSGNRGTCAQPCRLPYSLIDYKRGEVIGDRWREKYLLSPKDLNTIEYIEKIRDKGVISFKIEGRMKSPEYVAIIVKNYRKALDLGSNKVTPKDKEDMREIFNRGFTKGISLGDFGPSFISYDKPNNQGVASEELLNRARESFITGKIKYPIDMKVNISIGKPPTLIIKYKYLEFKVEGEQPVEKAKNLPLRKDTVKSQLSKLNDTVYYLDNIQINLENGAFMRLSQLNGLRRNGIEKIDNYRKNFNNREPIDRQRFQKTMEGLFSFSREKGDSKKLVSVKVSHREQFNQLNLDKLDRIYLGFYDDLSPIIKEIKSKNKEVYLWTSKILYEKDLRKLKNKVDPIIGYIDGISVSNIGTLKFVKDNWDTNIHGDIGLNTFNTFTAKMLKEEGINSITLSPELNLKQIESISRENINSFETIVYGYLPLMTMEYCPMSNIKNCKNDLECETCSLKSGYGIRDRMNMDFYMERRDSTTTVYNSLPLMVLDSIDRIYNIGVDTIRLDFTFEKEGIKELQEIYYGYAKGFLSIDERDKFIREYRSKQEITKGHYYRGVVK